MAWLSTKVVERSIIYYTNRERRKRGLNPLSGNTKLARAARRHSLWMSKTGRFSHKGQGGSSPSERTARAGYWHGTGENIWMNPGAKRSGATYRSRFVWNSDWKLGKAAVISWMNSTGHRRNLLHPDYRHIGIGVARSRRGTYLTQNFGLGSNMSGLGSWLVIPLLMGSLFLLLATVGVIVTMLNRAVASLGNANVWEWPQTAWEGLKEPVALGMLQLLARGVFTGMLIGAVAIAVVLVLAFLINAIVKRA